jgi:hypothetical protein
MVSLQLDYISQLISAVNDLGHPPQIFGYSAHMQEVVVSKIDQVTLDVTTEL